MNKNNEKDAHQYGVYTTVNGHYNDRHRQEKLNKKMGTKKRLKTCKNGHQFYKSSDCPTCPICEGERKPKDSFLSLLGAPARRAMENYGITTLEQLSKCSEKEVLALHGMGKSTIPKLTKLLNDKKLSFKL